MPKDIILPNVRLSFAHLDKPVIFVEGQGFIEDTEDGIYSSVLLIEQGSEAEKILTEAIKEVKTEAIASGIRDNTKKTVKVTEKDMLRYNEGVHDGDAKDYEGYAGQVYINAKAKAKFKPACYDKDNKRIENTEPYSGCYVNAAIRVYNYAVATNIGCGFGLTAIQFIADGERLAMNVDTGSIFGDKKEEVEEDTMF